MLKFCWRFVVPALALAVVAKLVWLGKEPPPGKEDRPVAAAEAVEESEPWREQAEPLARLPFVWKMLALFLPWQTPQRIGAWPLPSGRYLESTPPSPRERAQQQVTAGPSAPGARRCSPQAPALPPSAYPREARTQPPAP